MLRLIFGGTTAPGHHDCFNSGNERKLVIVEPPYRCTLATAQLVAGALVVFEEGFHQPSHRKAHQTVSFSGSNGVFDIPFSRISYTP
ncbi:hypothetical protein TNCV_4826351, partial [Trichonephila clavipes]